MFVVPLPASSVVIEPAAVRLYMALLLLTALFNLQAVWLFWLGMHTFKEDLRHVYRNFCLALLALGLAWLQIPVAGGIGAIWWLNLGFFEIPTIAACIFLFAASRAFAKLLGISGNSTNLWVVLGLGLAAVVVSLGVPAQLSALQPSVVGVRASLATELFAMVLAGFTAYNILKIKHSIGAEYTNAMQWLFVAVAGYFVTQVHGFGIQIIGFDNPYSLSGWSNVMPVIGALLFARAGYAFWRIGVQKAAVKSASPIDVVVYMTSLATNRTAINPLLDSVSMVTAKIAPGQKPSPDDEERLADIYLGLERYLTQAEPLRNFTKEELRQSVNRIFPHDPTKPSVFWQKIQTR